MTLILASASPRRRQLLAACGVTFEIIPAAIDEHPGTDEPAEAYVRRLALEKAQVVSQSHPGAVVVGADTIVSIGGRLLGKPHTADQARWMLRQLSGNMHTVSTGVAVVVHEMAGSPRAQCVSDVVTSHVQVRPFTEASIDWYIATGEPMDKAGAYAVQGLGAAFVERVEGSYTNVIGLPLSETLTLLRRFGIAVPPG